MNEIYSEIEVELGEDFNEEDYDDVILEKKRNKNF